VLEGRRGRASSPALFSRVDHRQAEPAHAFDATESASSRRRRTSPRARPSSPQTAAAIVRVSSRCSAC
jgi:hypothetical protein